ncbi:restriction endonuclease subunit S [Novosphingobium capsulatum]|uniref:restriction endonuclease subunit S n=1 Tax=Novosphingobium capsulatum TaxID=13688 RepID=UPI0007887090|nr:restriction endonuclease subunit S [Novosphingobium capsulatum]WQD92422.1 restriction endonuclease subunit S [Novosphingobium capsulatum]
MTLAQAGVALIDCVHATPAAMTAGLPYIAIPQMKDGRLDFDGARKISRADFIEWTRKARPQRHDIVLSRRTNPGVIAPVLDDTEFALGQNLVLLRADGQTVAPSFLRWLASSPYWWDQIAKFNNVGAIFDSLRCADVPNFELPIPPISEQLRIADLLAALDDKIELNRRMNATLERQARALFRDWFVDFGPTRAKQSGAPAYLAPNLWNLFPATLDSEGKPEGWRSFSVGELATQNTASINPFSSPDQLFEHYSLPAYDSGQSPAIDLGETIKSNKTIVPECAVLLSKLNPEISRVWLPDPKGQLQQVASTEFLAFVAEPWVGRNFLHYLFAEPTFRQTLEGMVTGTSKSHQRISPPALRAMQAVIADPAIIGAYNTTIAPMVEQLTANRLQSRTLAQTRDLLLPKLMSGEIRVAAAEREMSAVL